ncbi:methyltransferase-like protein 7A isoform X1 [Ornithorhynchus anatinus]|uniref:methyltransferase-like protein 7A isoform X1 n=1 Tax=Ornithorhynchus anatinus TaxID=9258 RepID=UPI0010A84249|nr:methyltransferase-like protein 7A isoform X1 [Ornithorhynchus anatinus]
MAWLVALLRLVLGVLATPLHLLQLLGLWAPLCKRYFPHFLRRFTALYNEQMAGPKRELFGGLEARARTPGRLALLELGCGTGANFAFYPAGCGVTCVDPNPHFERFVARSLAEHRQVRVERFVVSAGERMAQVDDASMDVVVCTLVLCSVRSQEDILREVFRVLRPGGAFYFLEHVAAEPNTWTAFWQQVLAPTWQLIFDGCDLTRETWKPLERAGFSRLQLQRMQAPLSWKIVRPHIMGFAVK